MKKIMFNDFYGLTQDVLAGRKTMTRRLISSKELVRIDDFQVEYYNATFDRLDGVDLVETYFSHHPERLPYKVGDLVAVAQKYKDCDSGSMCICWESLKNAIGIGNAGWNNKMFVRANLMPQKIKMLSYKVEYLQDISDDDCIAEGVLSSDKYAMPYGITDIKASNGVFFYYSTPKEAYADLIDRISGKGTWKRNPMVLAYKYELVK